MIRSIVFAIASIVPVSAAPLPCIVAAAQPAVVTVAMRAPSLVFMDGIVFGCYAEGVGLVSLSLCPSFGIDDIADALAGQVYTAKWTDAKGREVSVATYCVDYNNDPVACAKAHAKAVEEMEKYFPAKPTETK